MQYFCLRFLDQLSINKAVCIIPAAAFLFFMDNKLGFTWYPQDWWSSDAFFELTPVGRYIYFECLSLMYRNGGYMKTQKTQFENRMRLQVSEETWNQVVSRFVKIDGLYTSPTVNKRLKKAIVSRENGKKGGRPRKEEKTQKTQEKTQLLKEKEKENIILPFGEMFSTAWEKWLKYRKEIKKPYKSILSQEAALKLLSKGSEAEACAMIDQSITNQWQGLFELKSDVKKLELEKPKPNYTQAEVDKTLWWPEVWEKEYEGKLKHDNEFRKHFGYAELRSGQPMGGNSKGK